MDKPLNLLIEECKTNIIKSINDTKLPAFLLEPILKDIYMEISNNKKIEYENSKKQYEEKLKESEKNIETKEND